MDGNFKYKPRIADKMLQEQLEAAGVVLIEGSKWCGKTTTAEQAAKSVIYMDNPKQQKEYLFLAENNPELLFDGETPRLLDEWQLAPELWDKTSRRTNINKFHSSRFGCRQRGLNERRNSVIIHNRIKKNIRNRRHACLESESA